ncbi:hypothetical protein IFM89_001863 [Coptis chinensis]|uniref:RING-type domain-containing protein n=1 Tax=Coptis chinensis TaxID=261450 RepID=A0A835LPC7_9MAGN|nr:hypothetical protein IFM89_001863 [Coptis chinensis]
MENEGNKQTGKKVAPTQISQLDSDMALAVALQEQERDFMSLLMSESNTEDDNSTSSGDDSFNDDADEGEFFGDDTFEEEVSYEELEEDDGTEYEDMEEDDVDPDELSYEELIALGEFVGTENKGLLASEITNYFRPYSYKCQSSPEDGHQKDSNPSHSCRCVICQFEYEEGETVVALGCEHAYHSECISKWLQMNKVCPICNTEVSLTQSVPDRTAS